MIAMTTNHTEDPYTNENPQCDQFYEKNKIDTDDNLVSMGGSDEVDITCENSLPKEECSTLDANESTGPTTNGKSESNELEKVETIDFQTSMDNVSDSQSTEASPFSGPHSNGIHDLPTAMNTESLSTSPEAQLVETSDPTRDTGIIMEPSLMNNDKKLNLEPDNPTSDNGQHSEPKIISKKIAPSANDQQNCESTMELDSFFNETSSHPTETSVLGSQIVHHLNEESVSSSDIKMETNKTSQPTSKVHHRERDCDENIEPSAKRLRTHGESLSSHKTTSKLDNEIPNREFSPLDVTEETATQNKAITPYQVKEITKILRNISRTNAGKNFRQPVAVLWPSITEDYASKISTPMDLSTIEKKLKDQAYETINDLKADVHLIYNNSVTFNSAENPVSKCAMETRNALFSKLSNIPHEPIQVLKKEKKAFKRTVPSTDLAIRPPPSKKSMKESQVATPNSTQAFALDPTTNTPLIRRDSTKADGGRPKRVIHPPKNKDLSYSVRPKNRKHLLELKFCDEVLSELQKAKYGAISHPFMVPVDPVALGIPNYFAVIKKPMDISTVVRKLKDGAYVNANECEKDIRQVFTNCYKYNPEGNPVRLMGKSYEDVFSKLWAKKEQYLVDNTPSVASPSDRESDDESEDEEALDGSNASASLMSQKERLLEEQSKLITLMGAKHKDEGLLQMQTDLVELIQKRVKAAEEQARKLVGKKRAQKPSKKVAPARKVPPIKKIMPKKRYLGTLEKETISAGLGLIPAQVMAIVVEMIKTERPELEDAGDETMELDIDSISDTILWQIHAMIMKHVPELEGQIRESMSSEPRQTTRTAKPAPKRKNKPMSKHEQERKIEALTNLDSEFAKATFDSQESPMSGLHNYASSPHIDVTQALEPESSGDEDSDSEEE